MTFHQIKVATSAWIGNCYIRATKSFHKQERYDFIRIGVGDNTFYGELWLLFQYQDRETFKTYNLAWIQHMKQKKQTKNKKEFFAFFTLEKTAQVITIDEIDAKIK